MAEFRKLLFASAASASTLLAAGAHAQPTSGPGVPAALEEVIVTARRTQENVQTVPLAVTAVSGAQLAQAGVRDIQNLQTVAPGLRVASSGLSDRENLNFVIRGQGIVYGQVNQSVISYFNNVPVTPVGPSLFFDLSSVQVLKGPQGTLFGKNTTGGAILFEPNRPGEVLGGEIAGRLGNYGMRQLDGYFNAPIIEDKLLARLAVNAGKRDGFTHDLGSGKDLDDENYLAFRFSLIARPVENVENYLVVNAFSSDTNASGTVLDAVNPAGVARRLFPGLVAYFDAQQARGVRLVQESINNPHRDDRNLTLVDTLTWTVNDWLTLKNIFGWDRQRSQRAYDTDGTPFQILEQSPSPYFFINQNTYSDELQGSIRALDDRLKAVLGYYGSYSEPVGEPLGFAASLAPPISRLNSSILRSNSVYLQGSYETLPKLRITAGVRRNFDHQTNFAGQWGPLGRDVPYDPTSAVHSGCSTPGAGPHCVYRSAGDWSHTSWLLGADYKVNDAVMAYVTVRNGYKSGGLNGFIPDPTYSLYNPEVVDDVEVGVKSEFHVGEAPVRLNADAYRGKYKGLQRSTVLVTNLGVYAPIFNAAGARVKGLELEGAVKPVQWLSLSAFYDYIYARYTSYRTAAGVDLSATPFQYTPRQQYGATLRADLPLPERAGSASVSSTYSWQAHTHASNDLSPAEIPSYYTLNARLDWKKVMQSQVDLALFIDNPFNEIYRVFEGGYYTSLGFNTALYAAPRMWGLEARYHFK